MKEKDFLKKWIYKDCRKAMMPAVVLYFLRDMAGGLLTVYSAGILGDFADAVLELDLSYGIMNFWKLLVSIGASVLIVPAVGMLGEVLMFKNALRHDRMVYGRFFDKTYEAAMKIDAGEVQYRLEKDVNDFRCYWVDLWVRILALPFTLAYLLFHALQISPLFTVIVFIISLVKLAVPMAVKKMQAKYDKETREYQSRVRAFETEITTKPHIIKLYGLSTALTARLDNLFKKYYTTIFRKSVCYNAVSDSILSFLDTFCILAVLFVGAIMVSNGSISPGAVAAMVGYFSVFNTLVSYMDDIIRKIPIMNHLSERMKLFYEEPEEQEGVEVGRVSVIEARKLSFQYGDKTVLDHLDFSICAGEKAAIIGANGSGKSTLVKLLCGLLKGYKGSLKINGCELNQLSMDKWRSQFAYVAQEPYLFEGSIKENIFLGNMSATEETVLEIMNQLGISHLADRTVSANEKALSGGEKQRISIARALLRDADILFFDEPQNYLDRDSVIWLNDFISRTGKIVLYITHDKVVENGKRIRL